MLRALPGARVVRCDPRAVAVEHDGKESLWEGGFDSSVPLLDEGFESATTLELGGIDMALGSVPEIDLWISFTSDVAEQVLRHPELGAQTENPDPRALDPFKG